MTTLRLLLLIATFGAIGAVARYLVTSLCVRWFGVGFPAGTLAVNVIGCFLLGLLVFLLDAGSLPDSWRMPLAIGFLGSLTTFSTFGYDTFVLVEASKWQAALLNVGSNLALGLAAVWAGVYIGRILVGGG